ncbi:MAG TPA: alpha/beta hydrolase, partial [Verrucomicrobiae bacterium]|nr:alpha/beta hydrolase [Verrucomicrobiae bacterium]
RFVTLNPAVSARSHWVTVLQQERALEPSTVDVRCDPAKRRIVGSTANVAGMALELPALTPGSPLSVELDGQKLENIPWPEPAECSAISGVNGLSRRPLVCLVHQQGRWQPGPPPAPSMKNPRRSGPFRMAFQNHMVFVYGTHGSALENALLFNKARYDAESFWYRGNGSVEVMTDEQFLRRTKKPARNVIIYGNSDDNSAWAALLANSPVQVKSGMVRIGTHELRGEDLACLFLQPYPGDDQALIGVVAGSGMPGLRLTERLPYFLSGAAFPDCLVVGTDMLSIGNPGIRAAGFFGNDWSVARGEFDWNSGE